MKDCPKNQFEYWENRGFRIYTPEDIIVGHKTNNISLKVTVRSASPLTLYFMPAFYTTSYMIATPTFISTPGVYNELTIDIVNPDITTPEWVIEKGIHIATMVVMGNKFCNLLEVSNKYSEMR